MTINATASENHVSAYCRWLFGSTRRVTPPFGQQALDLGRDQMLMRDQA